MTVPQAAIDAAQRVERIGDATLLLGDATEIVPLLGECAVIISDPPYGMAFRSNHRRQKHAAIANDKDAIALAWACELPVTHSRYVFCRWDNLTDIPKPRSLVTWVKNNWSMGDLEHEHARQTEVVAFYAGPQHYFPSGRPSDVIRAPRTGNEHHPTEKPVALISAIVEWTDGIIVDPFMGSGTAGVACVQLGRPFVGIEVNEEYFETAVRRVSDAAARPRMFISRPAQAVQEPLFKSEAAE